MNQWSSAAVEEWKTCVHLVIERKALETPEKEAICCEVNGSLSYSELDTLASCFARHLITLGIKSGDIVPLCFEKSMWNVVTMLAVLKAGAAFCPLDQNAPIARLQKLVQNIQATTLICSQKYVGQLAAVTENIVSIDRHLLSNLLHLSSELPVVASSDLAYLIYTSGSVSIHTQ